MRSLFEILQWPNEDHPRWCRTVTLKQIFEIAKIKQSDKNLSRCSLESICRQVIGTSKCLGLNVHWDEGRPTVGHHPNES
eukprot:COSAG01_NODE_1133_length_11566_cov_25.815819_10_plen_80_part_00